MSRKSSLPQDAKSVSVNLMPDIPYSLNLSQVTSDPGSPICAQVQLTTFSKLVSKMAFSVST